MTQSADSEMRKITKDLHDNHIKLERTLMEFRDRVSEPGFLGKAFVLAGAVIVVGLFLFYDRNSKV